MVKELTDLAVSDLRPYLPDDDRGAEVQFLDVGFASLVARFGGSVARIARNDDAARSHAREVGTLTTLDGKLPVAVATPCRRVPPSAGLPHGALVQPYLPGRVMTEHDAVERPELAAEIADLLAALHRLSPWSFPDGSLWTLEPRPDLDKLEADTSAVLEHRLTAVQHVELRRQLEQAREVLPGRDRVVCHSDAWFGNMLVDDDGRITGLLDFEHAAIADPAWDLAAQTYLDPPSADQVIAAYEERMGALHDRDRRIRAYLLFRELSGLNYAARNDMPEEIDHCMVDVLGLLG